uniref:Uncharacterized protein n=1 Tax=Arundo donax TaxID=35708 RepID=A0A0A8Y5W3_ARUDO
MIKTPEICLHLFRNEKQHLEMKPDIFKNIPNQRSMVPSLSELLCINWTANI